MSLKPPSSSAPSIDGMQRVDSDATAASTPNTTFQAMPKAPSRSAFSSFLLIATCTMAMLVNTSNSTSVAISLPAIGRDLDIDEARLQWLMSAYALSSGCLLLIFGRLADLYGRKRIFTLGSLWLAAFTLACGFARNHLTLDILRGFQGIGVAASIPASLGILAHAFPPGRTRSIAFASFAAGAPIGAFMGNALGSVLTQLSRPTWRSTFFLSSGLTVLYILTGLVVINPDEPSRETDRRVDWFGALLVTAGLVLIVFVLSDGEIAPQGWRTPYIIACLIIGVFLLLLFLAWQWYLERAHSIPGGTQSIFTPPPLMKLSLWTRGRGKFSVIMVIALFNWCAFMGWMFWIQLYYQEYEHRSPVLTMVRLIPMFIFGLLCNFLVVLVVARVSIIWILASGTALTACAALLIALTNTSMTYWAFGFPSTSLAVFGADFVFAGGTIFVAKIVQPHEQSLAGGMFQTMTQLGTALGVTTTTIVFNRVQAQHARRIGIDIETDDIPDEVSLFGYRAAQWAAFAFGIIATILVLMFMRGVGIIGDEKPEPEVSPDSELNRSKDIGSDRTLKELYEPKKETSSPA